MSQTLITVLGATGSIGLNTLDVVAQHPERWQVFALTANTDVEGMRELCKTHRPSVAVMRDVSAAQRLREFVRSEKLPVEVLEGAQALEDVAAATEVDVVMAAIVGSAGLGASLAAARAGKKVLLANKESLVMAGNLFMQAVQQANATLLPIDSEHNAIFQCMPAGYNAGATASAVEKIILTASGGPFRDTPLAALGDITVAQACAHPNWKMGPKISVDSATMMNKGLELIEAVHLFSTPAANIDIVIHPQSVIHSLVQYVDGSVLAQLGNPDMRTPIAHGLAWPDRIAAGVEPLDLVAIAGLDFSAPDETRFPALRLTRQVASAGAQDAIVLNAANEIAVEAFLNERLGFQQIAAMVDDCLQGCERSEPDSLDAVKAIDVAARAHSMEFLKTCV